MVAQKREYSRLVNTIITLGSILIGLGILLFVASNWDKIDRPFKIFIIFGVISLFNLAVYYFRFIKQSYLGLAEGFCLIGSFAFGAGIWLIAQIYQIHYNFSAGILFWILGILPAVYIYRSWTTMSLAGVLTLVWLCSYQSYYFNREAYGFFLLAPLIIALCYNMRSRFSLFVMVVASCVWLGHFWLLKYSVWDWLLEHGAFTAQLLLAAIYMIFGFVLYGLGMWHLKKQSFTAFSFLYKFLGVLLISSSAYSLTFAHHYYKYHSGYCPYGIMAVVMALSVSAAVLICYLYNSAKEKRDITESRMLFYFLILGLAAVIVSFASPRFASAAFNITVLAQALGFLYLGFVIGSEGLFRLGIFIFFVHALSRYFDILWKMMPRSLLFIFGGILLIAGAIFADRKRRQIEEQMRASGAS